MGIQGLLKALEDVQRDCHVKEFAGKRAAIDAHGWLHAALAGSAVDVELEVDNQVHVRYCAKRISMLRKFGVEPVFVFDGAALPAKTALLQERRQRRELMRREGEQRLEVGDFAQAKSCLAQAVEIKDHQIDDVVQLLAAEEVRYIHAPFEADAQMVYLAWHGYVDFCISEDSDLLALGCPQVLYKLRGDGHGKEVLLEDALNGRSLEDFQAICVLMGCDYLPRLHGVGPALALKAVSARGCEAEAVVRELRALGISVPSEYAEHFRLASMVLQRQPVYEPRSGRQIPLQHQESQPTPPGQHDGKHLKVGDGCIALTEQRPVHCLVASAKKMAPCEGRRRSRSRTPRRQGHDPAVVKGRDLALREPSCGPQGGECGGPRSVFVSDSFEQARLNPQGAMTLQEFIRRESRSAAPVQGISCADGDLGDASLASPASSRTSRFFGRCNSASLWSD
ncbi:exo1 [Symbiodinium natans]|uniref:Exo1 protein n=1 Tax=Symbiodinium natans TaxID=878477 RepID=A0A812UVD3_9DINO|nr:exo1 [Symbiodinium natans]